MTTIPDLLPHEFEAVLGKTGSGKSNRAKIAVEAWLSEGRRVGIIDITDAWWGLKLQADGKAPAHDVVIFGGRHADVDLVPAMAAPLGQMLAKATFPWILSTAKLGENAMRAFLSDFFEALYLHLDAPLHLIMDEADEYAPQTTTGAIGELFGRVDRIVRRGRVKGFRVMMLTQRPAALNKNILAQADRLTAFKLTLPHDHAAIEGWIKGHGDKKRGQQVLDTLASLKVGTAWVWAPEHGMLERVAFPLARTFDSGRSPDGTVSAPVTALKPADLEKLRAQLGSVIEEAKANDPRLLRAEIARLQGELRRAQAAGGPTPADLEGARTQGFGEAVELVTRTLFPIGRSLADIAQQIAGHAERVEAAITTAGEEWSRRTGGRAKADASQSRPPAEPARPAVSAPSGRVLPPPAPKSSTPAADITGPQRTFLQSLAWWRAMGHAAPTRVQVATLCGWRVTSGHLKNVAGSLRSRGLIDYPSDGAISLTAAGAAVAPDPDLTASLEDSVRMVLTGPQRQVFDYLPKDGRPKSREQVAEACGWEPTSGHVKNVLGSMRSLEVITYPSQGQVARAEWVRS